jgi:hypothetical protein
MKRIIAFYLMLADCLVYSLSHTLTVVCSIITFFVFVFRFLVRYESTKSP